MSPFFIFVAVLFILSSLLHFDFFLTIFYLFVGIYIVLRMWFEHIMKNIFIKREFIGRAFADDVVNVSLYIENRSRFPIPWLLINESIHWNLATASSVKRVISVKGRETCRFTYRLQARQRGYYRVGPTVVYTGDLLGLRPNLIERLEADHLVVYPKVVSLVELGLPAYGPQVVLPASLPIFEDPARITGIRGYQWGDNPRHIHWPATAVTGQVMVKQFRPAIARESGIFLNLTRKDYGRGYRESSIELAITTAASLAYHVLTKEKLPVGFHTTAMGPLNQKIEYFNLPPVKERSQLSQILEILARVQPIDGESEDFLKNLRHRAIHLSWGSTIMVVTGRESDSLYETLLWLKNQGIIPTLVLAERYSGPEKRARHLLPTFEIQEEQDIKTWGLYS